MTKNIHENLNLKHDVQPPDRAGAIGEAILHLRSEDPVQSHQRTLSNWAPPGANCSVSVLIISTFDMFQPSPHGGIPKVQCELSSGLGKAGGAQDEGVLGSRFGADQAHEQGQVSKHSILEELHPKAFGGKYRPG